MRPLPAFPRLLSLLSLLLLLLATLPAAAQTFAQPTVIPTPSWPYTVYAGDFDGDGHQDLLYLQPIPNTTALQPDVQVFILYGDGKGGFSAPVSQLSFNSRGTYATTVADIDGDGISDFVLVQGPIAPAAQSIYTAWFGTPQRTVRLAAGAPSAWIPDGAKPPNYTNLIAMQFGGTGLPGLIALDSANNLGTALFQTYSHRFQPTYVLTLPDGTGPMAAVDLNQDGILDLVLLGQTNHAIDIFLGTTNNPIFGSPRRFTGVAGTIQSFLLQDVNLDGLPDLIAEGLNGRIDVFPGLGDGTFSTTSIGGTGTLDGLTGNGGHLITLADLNHDGQLDALTATPAGISTLFGAGTSYLKLGGIYNAGPGHTSYAVADFNGDGNLDLAVDSPEGIAILYGNADGSFQTSRSFASAAPAFSGALGVFTASGHPDAAVSVSDSQAQLLKGNGDGTFQFVSVPPVLPLHAGPNLWSILSTGDFNGDGKPDLLLSVDGSQPALNSTYVFAMTLLEGNGDGTFKSSNPDANTPYLGCQMNHSQYFGTTVAVDLNADGITDAVKSTQGILDLLGSKGLTTLNPDSSSNPHGSSPCSNFAHDLSAVVPVPGAASPEIIDQFGGHLEVAFAPYPIPDLAVDGALTTPGQLTAPDISTTFGGTSATFNQPYFPGAMLTADLDRDGNTDLLVTYANLAADPTAPSTATPNYLYIWYGSGGGKFLTSPAHPVNPVRIQLSRNYYQVSVFDLNNDGIPDLILSDGYIVSYQLGLGDGTFGPEHHLLAGRGINTISTADLRGIGAHDLVLANGGAALTNPVANHDVLAADPDVNTGGITVLLNTAATTAPLTSTLTASPEPSVYSYDQTNPKNSDYTITATLTATPTPTGTVTFSEDGVLVATATLVSGSATVPGLEVDPGTHSLTATYSGDSTYPASTITPGSHTVQRAPTSIILNPTTPLTVYYGQAIDGTFNVQPTSGRPANGNYTLFDNGVAVPVCTNIPTSQYCPYGNPIFLDAGPHVFSLAYLGDTYNAPSTSPNYPYTVLPDLTTLALATSATPAYLGQPVTLTATATGNVVSPVGSVTFSDGAQLNQTGPLTAGTKPASTAVLAVTGLTLGTHTITASYPGTLDFNPAISPSITQQIIPDLTTVSLTSSLNPATKGAAVTFTAVVTGNYLPPTGALNFFDGTTLLAGGTLTVGPGLTSTLMFTTSTLAIGTHPITAVYAGNVSFNPATSQILNELIQPVSLGTLASFTTVTSNLNPSAPQQLVTFTAQVQVPGTFITIPNGTVTFLDGAATLGTATLNSFGIATFQTAALATGTHPITASYAGAVSATAPTILPSVSAVLNQVVTIPLITPPSGFLLTVTPGSLTLGVGRTGILAINILAVSGFNQPVQLSCSNLAPETSCVFSPSATVPPGGGNVTMQLFTNAPRDCNTNTPYFLGSTSTPRAPFGIAAATLFFFAMRRRRRIRGLLLFLAAATALTTLAGCGHCTDLGTKPGTYSFQITATAQGTPITETKTVTIPLTMTIP